MNDICVSKIFVSRPYQIYECVDLFHWGNENWLTISCHLNCLNDFHEHGFYFKYKTFVDALFSTMVAIAIA